MLFAHALDVARVARYKMFEALNALRERTGVVTVNLGTGRGYSVLEIIHAFEEITSKKINYKFAPRRTGDVAENYANPAIHATLCRRWSNRETRDPKRSSRAARGVPGAPEPR